MSRTKRKDPIDHDPKTADRGFVLFGEFVSTKPTAEEKRRAHMDRKKWHKPGRGAKVLLHKGRKAKVRTALAKVVENPDEAPLPKERKSDLWNYS